MGISRDAVNRGTGAVVSIATGPTSVTCDAVVRNFISRFPQGRARNFIYCGAEFTNIDAKDRETIFYYCFQRQREELKKGNML